MPHHATPLKFLFPGWYAIVMGLTGLALAWHRAVPLMGEAAAGTSLAIGLLALLVFVALAVATVMRALRHADAWAEDRRHPVRHTFVATLPVAVILLATTMVAHELRGPLPEALWALGAAAQLAVTAWVLAEWSAAQFGVGLLFWPVVTVLIGVRIAQQGLWPDRLRPTTFIFIAPPAVVGLSALQFGAPVLVVWALWGMAIFTLAWVATQARAIAALPFGLPHWGMSFPLAALAALTLRLAGPGGPMALLGVLLLALASLVIAALLLGTLRGLREGSLLVPEPVAALQPAA